ncbi:MarR family winged helix-turn-helix transcriptional regulator [Flindersiella endophytica]
MEAIRTDGELTESLLALACMVDGVRGSISRAAGLTPQQAQLLAFLRNGERTHGQLADLLHCDKTNVTGLVDRLERRDLVRRHLDDGDRRVTRVALTPAGAEVVERFHADTTAVIARQLDTWSRSRRDTLTKLAGSAAEALQATKGRDA